MTIHRSSIRPTRHDAMDGCAREATQRGLFAEHPAVKLEDEEPGSPGRHSVSLDGFNLHAAVRIAADDDVARERLVRYCARPPFALERISLLPNGNLAYQVKQPRKGATHRILTPLELLARITALIPPPRHPFMRYHGVLAPNSKWRKAIVPHSALIDASATAACPLGANTANGHNTHASSASADIASPQPAAIASADKGSTAATAESRLPRSATHRGSPARAARPRAPFAIITPAHRRRALDGLLLAEQPRIDWARLLRRTFAEDVLTCPRCRGKARVLAALHDPQSATAFLRTIDKPSPPASPSPDRAWPTLDDHVQRAAPDEDTLFFDTDDDVQLAPPSSRPTIPLQHPPKP